MATVPEIIADLGGPAAIGAQIGVPLTTVDSWKRNHFVPAWRIPSLVALAKKAGKPITAADFPDERPAKPASAREAA